MGEIPIWGGVECSVNRIADRWHDQLELSGHARRVDDLNLIADLGIRTLRYPVSWERTAPRHPLDREWDWSDERLGRLRALGIEPIVGLVHHGSGPRYTSLLHDNFAPALADFAAAVATRYPWVDRYTPVNEPLTTARFSALYGLWYPHRRDNRSFARALLNQCRAIALSMKAIRGINPNAELVQTEDMGTTYGTSHMGYQQRFDNERRWLTWDILCGRVDRHHALRPFLENSGIAAVELNEFVDEPCPPQLLGINHYVTSDRYLDEHLVPYPLHTHGGNAIERYADVDAVRVLPHAYRGWQVIHAVWERYQLPIALTEVHLGCTREEQLRWFEEARRAAAQARSQGCDLRAVTAWSLFGAYNWDKLLTRTDGSYEPGAFDVRGPRPRPTALATLIRNTNRGGEAPRTTGDVPGWWHRPQKILYPAPPGTGLGQGTMPRRARAEPRGLLICGARGSLGRALVGACGARNLRFSALSRADLDIADSAAVKAACNALEPWAIVNAAGYVRVDEAERRATQCFRANQDGPGALAAAADARHIPLLTFSSDLVFDGNSSVPYVESSPTNPLNVYGRSKLAAEVATLGYPRTLCIRTATFFGAWGRGDFLTDALSALRGGRPCVAMNDVAISPTYLPDLADASLDLLIDGCTGLIHLANRGVATWAQFLTCAAAALGVAIDHVELRRQAECQFEAIRPRYSALTSELVRVMPTLEDAIGRYADVARRASAGCTWPTDIYAEPARLRHGNARPG